MTTGDDLMALRRQIQLTLDQFKVPQDSILAIADFARQQRDLQIAAVELVSSEQNIATIAQQIRLAQDNLRVAAQLAAPNIELPRFAAEVSLMATDLLGQVAEARRMQVDRNLVASINELARAADLTAVRSAIASFDATWLRKTYAALDEQVRATAEQTAESLLAAVEIEEGKESPRGDDSESDSSLSGHDTKRSAGRAARLTPREVRVFALFLVACIYVLAGGAASREQLATDLRSLSLNLLAAFLILGLPAE